MEQVLERTAGEALLDPEATAGVVASMGDLRRSWLLRNSAIGFTHQVGIVTRECVSESRRWCYGTGWTATRLFAPNRSSALAAIESIRRIFDAVAPQ